MIVAGKTTFSKRLTALREAAGLSQYALAHRAGLTKQALSVLEQGTREPSWPTVRRLARALGVTPSDFDDPGESIEGVTEPEPPPPPAPRKGKRPRGGS